MRKWYIPVTVLGISSVGLFLWSGRGRQAVRWIAESLQRAPDALQDWNSGAQIELDRIQAALNRVAESLKSQGELGAR